MPQVRKPEIRAAILRAAAQELAEVGAERATLAAIAARAGTSVGNLYKYFADKGELLDAAVPPSLVRELRTLLRRRVEALGAARDVGALAAGHPYGLASEELLALATARRAELRFLLHRAVRTTHASFADELAAHLAGLARAYARRAYPRARLTPARRRALLRAYRGFVRAIASILDEETSAPALREAIGHLTTIHLAGLRAFFEATARADVVEAA